MPPTRSTCAYLALFTVTCAAFFVLLVITDPLNLKPAVTPPRVHVRPDPPEPEDLNSRIRSLPQYIFVRIVQTYCMPYLMAAFDLILDRLIPAAESYFRLVGCIWCAATMLVNLAMQLAFVVYVATHRRWIAEQETRCCVLVRSKMRAACTRFLAIACEGDKVTAQ